MVMDFFFSRMPAAYTVLPDETIDRIPGNTGLLGRVNPVPVSSEKRIPPGTVIPGAADYPQTRVIFVV